ncbi:zinc ABC transporter substrate-binding protein [Deinococcus marmoris]
MGSPTGRNILRPLKSTFLRTQRHLNASCPVLNAREYGDQIRAVGAKLKTQLASLPKNQRALVTCEGAFSYLTRDYNLAEHYLWPVNAEKRQRTPRQIKGVIDVVRA